MLGNITAKFRAEASGEVCMLRHVSSQSGFGPLTKKGQAWRQMARRGEMQEVSGLEAAHTEDQTYGKPTLSGMLGIDEEIQDIKKT